MLDLPLQRGESTSASREMAHAPGLILYEKEMKLKLSGNEVHCTNAVLLLVNIMLCVRLHCQRGFNSIPPS